MRIPDAPRLLPEAAGVAEYDGRRVTLLGPYGTKLDWWLVSGSWALPGTQPMLYVGRDEAEARKVFEAEAERLRNG
jgi:hypothetical protein